jgi:hypothetical protein
VAQVLIQVAVEMVLALMVVIPNSGQKVQLVGNGVVDQTQT